MHRFSPLWLLALLVASSSAIHGETKSLETWYPFPKGDKWGFIDSHGNWKIQPAFDAAYTVFDHDLERVWSGKKWGYIDRTGRWIIHPEFDQPLSEFNAAGYQVAIKDKREGIISDKGAFLIPPKYDEIVLSSDRAWVRKGAFIGVLGFDGKWIHQLNIPWSLSDALPCPLNSDGVAWFQQGQDGQGDWGLIRADGTILFTPQFKAYEIDRNDEGWEHPEGSDFQAGTASVGLLITSDGKIVDHPAGEVGLRWTDHLYHFYDKQGSGLISDQGKVVFFSEGSGIHDLHDGVAVFSQSHKIRDTNVVTTFGLLSSEGKVVVLAGTYLSIEDFHEGFAAATREALPGEDPSGVHGHSLYAGFLDRNGHELIPFIYNQVGSFSDGLAPVLKIFDSQGNPDPQRNLWGYIDATGKEQVPRKFGWTTPFFRDRAWVAQGKDDSDHAVYAMIDRTGAVLTDFKFNPPEKRSLWLPPDRLLAGTRWRGSLAVIMGWPKPGVGGLGLATAGGEIVTEPQFSELGPLCDGMISATIWNGQVHLTGFLNDQGNLALPPVYGQATDFVDGTAWVTYSPDDHKGQAKPPSWWLIDHQGNLLTSEGYVDPGFLVRVDYKGIPHPTFFGELASVSPAKTYQPHYGEKDRLKHLSWGYINRTGHVVAWHTADKK